MKKKIVVWNKKWRKKIYWKIMIFLEHGFFYLYTTFKNSATAEQLRGKN